MSIDRELIPQINILRTCLRETATTIRRLKRGQRVDTEDILKRIGLEVREAKEVAGEARGKVARA